MAFSLRGSNLPGIVAGADLSGDQHKFVSINAAGKAVLSGAAAIVDAVLEDNPIADQAASLMGPGSVAKVVASAAIAAGAEVASAANGEARTAVQFDFIVGRALTAAGQQGDLISVWMNFPGTKL